jgi:hypothetical protein
MGGRRRHFHPGLGGNAALGPSHELSLLKDHAARGAISISRSVVLLLCSSHLHLRFGDCSAVMMRNSNHMPRRRCRRMASH